MMNTFSLKYRLKTDCVRSALAYLVSDRMQLAAPLRHGHICMLTGARLVSYAVSFKCVCSFNNFMRPLQYIDSVDALVQ